MESELSVSFSDDIEDEENSVMSSLFQVGLHLKQVQVLHYT
jgi:hypothetical protein